MAVQAKVLYDFEGDTENGELTIYEGDTVTVVNQDIGDGWWEGETDSGDRGLFPEAYVELLGSSSSPGVVGGGYNSNAGDYNSSAGYNDTPVSANEYGGQSNEWDDSFYQPDSQGPPPYSPGGGSEHSTAMSRTQSTSGTATSDLARQTTVKKNINRFSPFVKVGAEAFVLGVAAKKAPRIADAERIRIIYSMESEPMWEPPVGPYRVEVRDPEKKSKFKGIKTFTAYHVIPSDTGQAVSRRYKHYDWLHDRLTEKFMSFAIPPLPDKQYYSRFGEEFVAKRKKKLEDWTNRVARHPVVSRSFVFRHFLTCADEGEWKTGKRRAEKDEFCGAQLLLTVEHPDVRVDLNKATEKVEHFGKFVSQFDETTTRMFQKFDDHCNKMSGPIMREWHRMSAVISGMGQCFAMEDAPYARGLTEAIQNTGRVYEEIGTMHQEQPKYDMIPIMDSLKEYLGMMHELPEFVQINRGAQGKVRESVRLKDEGRLDMVEASELQSRTETVATTVLAEIYHFQHERVTDFRESFQNMLQAQITFYKKISSKLQDALNKFDTDAQPSNTHDYNQYDQSVPGTDL